MLAGARRIERLRRRASGRVYLVFRGRYSPREWDVVARPTGRCRAEIITVRRVGVVAPVDRAGELGEDEGKFGAITRALGSWLWGSPSTAAAQAATRMLSSASGGGTTAHSVRVIWLEPCRLDLCLHKHRNVLYLLVRTGGARKVPIYVCSETSEASKRMNEYSRASIFSGSIPWVSRRTSGT
jgi:hypothetical protein